MQETFSFFLGRQTALSDTQKVVDQIKGELASLHLSMLDQVDVADKTHANTLVTINLAQAAADNALAAGTKVDALKQEVENISLDPAAQETLEQIAAGVATADSTLTEIRVKLDSLIEKCDVLSKTMDEDRTILRDSKNAAMRAERAAKNCLEKIELVLENLTGE